jgi:hypothetical protein
MVLIENFNLRSGSAKTAFRSNRHDSVTETPLPAAGSSKSLRVSTGLDRGAPFDSWVRFRPVPLAKNMPARQLHAESHNYSQSRIPKTSIPVIASKAETKHLSYRLFISC